MVFTDIVSKPNCLQKDCEVKVLPMKVLYPMRALYPMVACKDIDIMNRYQPGGPSPQSLDISSRDIHIRTNIVGMLATSVAGNRLELDLCKIAWLISG